MAEILASSSAQLNLFGNIRAGMPIIPATPDNNDNQAPVGKARLACLATNKTAGHIGFCLHHPRGA